MFISFFSQFHGSVGDGSLGWVKPAPLVFHSGTSSHLRPKTCSSKGRQRNFKRGE